MKISYKLAALAVVASISALGLAAAAPAGATTAQRAGPAAHRPLVVRPDFTVGDQYHITSATGYQLGWDKTIGDQLRIYNDGSGVVPQYAKTVGNYVYYVWEIEGSDDACIRYDQDDNNAIVTATCDTSGDSQWWWWDNIGGADEFISLVNGDVMYAEADANHALVEAVAPGTGTADQREWNVTGG